MPGQLCNPNTISMGKRSNKPLLDHHPAAAFVLFGGLEDEIRRAVEVAQLAQGFGGTQQHGGMPVVATGVHAPLVRRVMREGVQFAERQGVHVGTQTDRTRSCCPSESFATTPVRAMPRCTSRSEPVQEIGNLGRMFAFRQRPVPGCAWISRRNAAIRGVRPGRISSIMMVALGGWLGCLILAAWPRSGEPRQRALRQAGAFEDFKRLGLPFAS
jgi:hypothetical protein